jgi:FSR family fosmidomycin resistance protein-like MFS transporter
VPAIQRCFGLSYLAVAIVPFLTQATSAILQPTLGYLADRYAWRRPALALGFLAIAVAMLGLTLSQSYLAVLIAAVCLGIGGSTYHPQSATMLIYFFERRVRGLAQGVHGIGNALGFALAPIVIGFLLSRLDWHQTALWLTVPTLLGVTIVVSALREPVIRGHRGLLAGITPALLLLTVVSGLALASSSSFVNWLPSYFVHHGYSLASAALLTAPTSAAAFLAQPLGGAISDRLGRRKLLVVALAGTAVSLGVFLIAPSVVWAISLSIVVGFWASLIPPVVMVYASELAAGERTGTAVGVVWGLGTTISALALPATGRIIDVTGGRIESAYTALTVVAALAALLASRLPRE